MVVKTIRYSSMHVMSVSKKRHEHFITFQNSAHLHVCLCFFLPVLNACLDGWAVVQGFLLSDLWILQLPDAQDSGSPQEAYVWTLMEATGGPENGRMGHSMVVFGSKLALMGGYFGPVEPDENVYILNASSDVSLHWMAKLTGTPGAFVAHQATGSVGSVFFAFGTSLNEADCSNSPLLAAQASPWFEAANPRTECQRMQYMPALGMCAGRTVVLSSCSISSSIVQDKIHKLEMEIPNATVAKGPMFYHERQECLSMASSTCMLLLRDVLVDPPLCNPSFLCAPDSLYTSWGVDYVSACSYFHNSRCSNEFLPEPAALCCDMWLALQEMNCEAGQSIHDPALMEAAEALTSSAISSGYCSDSSMCYSLCPPSYWLNGQGKCIKCTDCVSKGLFPEKTCTRLSDAVCKPLGQVISAAKHLDNIIIPRGRYVLLLYTGLNICLCLI
jgi:hypothetical protein